MTEKEVRGFFLTNKILPWVLRKRKHVFRLTTYYNFHICTYEKCGGYLNTYHIFLLRVFVTIATSEKLLLFH